MAILGWLIAFGFAAALTAVAVLLVLGGKQAFGELAIGFRSRPARPPERLLILLVTYVPIIGLVLFIILTIGRIVVMAV